ncbi:amino acid adenylation domain-containing protein [Nodularia harveyana UHCC-0300]|uniref:Amino acid adenylation domain-containing protein n=1 Tax=Nodularia harveyana UHCC-0300 TaxID=2974287 RepID=A0A9E7VDI6_9CYAN|nr:non-ribosomal peptide synthetase [Nodularia harveyana]MEA5581860.1 amino acid adenylation domain-containing protein [Nodularia harveyana UHCC-0300]UZC80156.1 PuwG [Nodularia harveyana UHCC-0300]
MNKSLTAKKQELLKLMLKKKGISVKNEAIARRNSSQPAPLSFSQQRLWFLNQWDENSASYNIPTAVQLTGELQVTALEQALREIVHRHEILRTSFQVVDDTPVQVVDADVNITLSVVDLQGIPSPEQTAEVQQRIALEVSTPFDLTIAPLFRVQLLRLGEISHLLLLNLHHIVSDGWSVGVFIQELSALYTAFIEGKPSPLPELAIQYADFAAWQRQSLTEEVLGNKLEYWRSQLADATPLLELPSRPRPPIQTYRGSTFTQELSAELTQQFKTLSQETGVTLFMALQAAFVTLLHRYSSQTDILIGTPVANRDRQELEPLIGFFVNTLVLRHQIAGNPSFLELLQQVQQTTLDGFSHQDVPFEQVVEALQPERNLSYSPLFQVMFALQNAPVGELELSGLKIAPREMEIVTAKFDLTVSMEEIGGKLRGTWEYNCDLFDNATITQMAGHFQNLLNAIATHPQQAIADLPLLTPSERHQILVEWNQTQAEYPTDVCLHQLFEAQVQRTPNHIAVIGEEEKLTYSQLNTRANQLAHYLQSVGVGADTLVGIYAERSLEMVVGLLGILKAGGAYLPLDPEYPAERLAFMIQDAEINILLTQTHLLDSLPSQQAQIICLDQDSYYTDETHRASSSPSDLAYVIYTSGSTGKPKGVMIPHRAIVNHMVWMQNTFPLTSHDQVLQKTPFSFDAAIWEFYAPLLAGAQLVMAQPGGHRDSTYLIDVINKYQITTLQLVPSLLRMLLDSGDFSSCKSLKRIFCGGEVLTTELVERCQSQINAEIYNLYGPTEATIDATCSKVAAGINQTVPIGCPIANTQIYLLDQNLQPVPVGVPGEIYIGGAGLARGYLHRPELTQERFIPNPFSEGHLYKTGDLARYLPDGQIEYLGRVDFQVKLRGFRIELGEIETALTQHPQVQQAAAIIREDQPGDQRLVAYIIPAGDAPTSDELRHSLQQQLPDYMIPTAFVVLDTFPLTPNGKLNRNALPAPEINYTSENFVSPRTETEVLIADVFAAVLRITQVSIHDNFFTLGGHSLLATQVISRLRQIFGLEIPLRLLFESPTVAELDQAIQKLQQTESDLLSPPLVPVTRDSQPLPLSWSQQRLWFLSQLEESSSTYNVPAAIQLQGYLHVAALEQALQEIVRRHEILRTSFPSHNGIPTQVIVADVTVTLPVIDLQGLPVSEQAQQVKQLTITATQTVFDLTVAPLMRSQLLCLDQESHILLINLHHIVCDGWSVGVFIEELSALYTAFVEEKPSPLPELAIQYADFAIWQRQWLSGEVLDKKLNYWKQQLAGAPPLLELPTDRPRPPQPSYQGGNYGFTVDAELTTKLQNLSQKSGVTLFMTLQAVFVTLLHRYSGQTDILVGTPIANRDRAEIEPLLGLFINSLVLRSQLTDNPKFSQLLQQVRQVALEAYAYQDVPFEQIVEALQPERNLSYSPLFQVMFIWQNTPSANWELPGLSLSALPMEIVTAKFDLTLAMEETPAGLAGNWEYNSDLFDLETIQRIAHHFQNLLAAVTADPEQPVALLPLLTASEAQKILVDWNQTQATYPTDVCLHQLFEAQVEKTPDAIAVEIATEQLTYTQLNSRANQLAAYLQSLGVGTDQLVGICVERSLDMLVGLLAILKAGGAYVPLDPKYPAERIAFMVENAEVAVLLTQQHLVNSLPTTEAKIICLDTDWLAITANTFPSPISTSYSPSQLAYVIYTSGSTGQPKGVQIIHSAVVNFLTSVAQQPGITAKDVLLSVTTLSFDIAVLEIFLPLIVGAKVVLVSAETSKDGYALQKLLLESHATIMQATPATWRILLASGWNGANQFKIFSVGEALPRDLANQLLARSSQLWNAYGPTETTIWSTVDQVEPGEGKVLIGRPIANTEIYLLDTYGQPVPIGVGGELHIGGAGLARGYRHRPDLTADKFVELALGSDSPSPKRLYKTGDLARYTSDGKIEYLGRIDHQVKLRGFRIELGEIEAGIIAHPQVKQAAVIVREDQPGNKRLVGYVVSQAEAPTNSELRTLLQQQLPEYMIPQIFVYLEALPLTPNGKIDRRALPVPDVAASNQDNFVSPRNFIEESLVNIWGEIIGLEQVGIHDNFFDLGGDSIISIQVIARAHQLGIQLTLKQIFQHQTISELAQVCTMGTIPAEQGLVTGEIPLTPIQHWFFEQNSPEPHHFNQSILLEVQPDLQPELLQQVLQKLLEHHDALRLRFGRDDSQWSQVNGDGKITAPFEVMDLSTEIPAQQSQRITAIATELQASLNLLTGELLRVVLFYLGTDKPSQLLIIIHHLAIDGVSWRILLEDLSTAYQQLSRGEIIQLPAKTNSFQDWGMRLLEYGRSPTLKSEIEYWLRQSHNVPLPVDYPQGQDHNTVASAKQVSVSLSESETLALLQEVPQAYNTQINDILLTACLQSCAQWTGNNSLLMDLEAHGREELFADINLSRTVGWFTAIFPVLLSLEENPHPGEALKSIKEQLRRIPQKGINYGILRYLSDDPQIRQQLADLPPAEVCFNYLGQFERIPPGIIQGFADISTGENQSPSSRRRYLLEITGIVAAGKLQINLIYSAQVHQKSTIQRLADNLITALQTLISHCQSTVGGYTPSDFPVADLSQDELDALLAEIDE